MQNCCVTSSLYSLTIRELSLYIYTILNINNNCHPTLSGNDTCASSSTYRVKQDFLPHRGQAVLLPGLYFWRWNLYSLMALYF